MVKSGSVESASIVDSSEKTIEAKSVSPGFIDKSFNSKLVYKSVSLLAFGLGPTKDISPIRMLKS